MRRPAGAQDPGGRQQVPWVGARKEWPADDEIITITLTREQWELALGQLVQDQATYADLGDQESLQLGRDAGHAIRRQLR
jgi:hypothetical protein